MNFEKISVKQNPVWYCAVESHWLRICFWSDVLLNIQVLRFTEKKGGNQLQETAKSVKYTLFSGVDL